MRQNHPDTSSIVPQSIRKHIPKLFWGGGDFSPQVPQKRLSLQTPPRRGLCTNRPYKTAKTSTGPSCATPKPVCGDHCGQPSAWMPPTVSQDTTQSLWDPTLGSQGHPGPGKIQLFKFSPFSSQFCLAKLPKPPRDHLVRPQNPPAGVPAGNQVLGCLLQCPKTPYNHYGTLPWGPQGSLGPANPTF